MSTANEAIATYFVQLNDFERHVYLQDALNDPTIEVGVSTAGKPTGLVGTFSPESIKARLDALSLLTVYGERLTALAGTDAPTRFSAGSKVLGENLGNLRGTFETLKTKGDPTADRYLGPIGTIVGVVGEMVLERKRDAALTKAITEGEQPVIDVLNQIEKDLVFVATPLNDTGLLQALEANMNYYNANRTRLTYAEREAVLAKMDSYAARYQATLTAQPAEAIDGIRDAHAALVEYARSSRTPKDLATLVSALETFNNRLEPVVNSINQMKGDDGA
jgi:hypothetical protein